MAKKQSKTDATIEVVQIKTERMVFCVRGKTPLINHRLSEKVKLELLFPARKKNQAERQATLKHDPFEEFRESPYTLTDGPTVIALPAVTFKSALRSVAVDMPGATKAQMGRLSYVEGEKVPIYGIPKLFMTPVRNSGINRAPDIRTRAIIAEWAAYVPIRYTTPMLNLRTVNTLFQAAGVICGVGDWRPEKGSGNYGTFDVVDEDDPEFLRIVKEGGRKAQEAAMKRADPYDAETEELLTWFEDEAKAREFKIAK